MAVNAKLDAAQAHFGQDAATLSMVLILRQRKVRLIKLRTGQWMTNERGEPRMSFSKQVVADALEVGLLRSEGVDEDGPSLLALTFDGDKLAGDVLVWLKAQATPPPVIARCECGHEEPISKRALAAKAMENHARNAYATTTDPDIRHDDYTILED